MVLGLFEAVHYDGRHRRAARAATRCVVYSDGVTETWDPDGEEFGEDKLIAFAVAGRAQGAEAVQNAILCEIERFEQGARATDDRTLIVLKREAAA